MHPSVTNNCSDLAATGVSENIDRYKSWIELRSDEQFGPYQYTTPNGLYKYVRTFIESDPSQGKELKNPGGKVEHKFADVITKPGLKEEVRRATKGIQPSTPNN